MLKESIIHIIIWQKYDHRIMPRSSRGTYSSLQCKWHLYKFLVKKEIDIKPEYRLCPLYTKTELYRS